MVYIGCYIYENYVKSDLTIPSVTKRVCVFEKLCIVEKVNQEQICSILILAIKFIFRMETLIISKWN